jgi:biopolymer transport protein ExbD
MPPMKEGGVNVTPLIDIVMCLIIFFMLVAKIGVATGADEKIVPPETLLGSRIEDMGNTLTLNVRDPVKAEAQRAAEKGETPAPLPEIRREQPAVSAMVESGTDPRPLWIRSPAGDRELARVLDAVVKKNPNLRIIIRADGDIEYHLLEQVLMACAEAKVKDFNFETRSPG